MSISAKYLKDYKVVDYQNPRLRKKMQEQRKRGALAFFSILFVVAAGLIYFFFFSPFFVIKKVNVESATVAPEAMMEKAEEQLSRRFLFVFSRRNIWFFNIETLTAEIKKDYFLDELQVVKHYPNAIDIVLKEKSAVMHWLSAGQCHKVDAVGMIIGFCGEGVTAANIIEVRDLRPGAIAAQLGQLVAAQADLNYIAELNQGFLKALSIEVNTYEFLATLNETKVYFKNGPEIYLNQQRSAGEIISKLSVLFDKEISKDKMGKIGYIDMRFGEKIYYQ
jgi:cell division septal protein FtsQ